MHPLTFIGAGPGDLSLLTLGGADALRAAPFVVSPASFQRSFAPLLDGREVVSPFQMDHAALTAWIRSRLQRGAVAFLVPGDFGSFCPFQSFVAEFRGRAVIVPGIPAHAAAAAVLQKTFDLPGVAHATILTSPRAFTRAGHRVRLRDYAAPGHTLVIYMNDLPLPELVRELRLGFGGDVPLAVLEELSTPDQRVTLTTLDEACAVFGGRDPFGIGSPDPEPSLALVVAGETLTRDEDPSWWDRRYHQNWKPRGVR